MYGWCCGFCIKQRDVETHVLCPSFQLFCCFLFLFFLRRPGLHHPPEVAHHQQQKESLAPSSRVLLPGSGWLRLPLPRGELQVHFAVAVTMFASLVRCVGTVAVAPASALRCCCDNVCKSRSMRRNCCCCAGVGSCPCDCSSTHAEANPDSTLAGSACKGSAFAVWASVSNTVSAALFGDFSPPHQPSRLALPAWLTSSSKTFDL